MLSITSAAGRIEDAIGELSVQAAIRHAVVMLVIADGELAGDRQPRGSGRRPQDRE